MKMEDSQLITAIEQYESQAVSYTGLQDDREEALDYYLGEPLGNEVPGRSQVIARQVWDTVEWLKPQLADIFTSGEEVVAFSPRSPEDVKAAEQETDYINHIITQRNNWFEIWYSWTHDALIQKNGYVKAYWDDAEDITCEKYSNLTDDEFALLSMSQDIEITEHEVILGGYGPIHTVEIERKKPRNTVKIDNIPPENIKVDHHARALSLQDPRTSFVEHSEMKTISEVRAEGLEVDDDINDGGVNDWEEQRRDKENPWRDNEGQESDPSMRRVRVRECWIRCDYDGDGRAELRHVIVIGTTVLYNEDCDSVPIVALCPIPLPHQHNGLSLSDAVMDLQRIQTALLRGALDNQYLANNGRYGIDENTVNLDDMLDSRPGGVVRVNGPAAASIMPLTHPTNGSIAIPMMEYVDNLAQKRTGVNERSQGIDANSLNNNAGVAANNSMISASQQRIKFIARIFAETGVKQLFQLVHELTLKNSRQQEIIQLRGEWVPVDPRTWTKRNDMVISVALGSGDRPQQIAFLSQLRMMQMEMAPMGLATPKHLYNTVTRMARAAGYKDANEFWNDPSKSEPPQPPQDPKLMIEQMKQQNEVHKFQAEQQMTASIEQIRTQAKLKETQMQLELQASNDARDAERERNKAVMDAQMEQLRIESEQKMAMLKAEVDKYKADLDSQTKLTIAGMNNEQSMTLARESNQNTIDGAATEKAGGLRDDIINNVHGMVSDLATSLGEALQQQLQHVDKSTSAIIEQVSRKPVKKVIRENGKITGVEIDGVFNPVKRGPTGQIEEI